MTRKGKGIFDDIANGLAEGMKLLGGRIATLEDHFDVPELSHDEYIEKFHGSGFADTLWDAAKKVLGHPVTKTVLTAALPVALKVLAGKVAHLEEHAAGLRIAGHLNHGGAYVIDEGGDYAVAGKVTKKTTRKKAGELQAGEYEIGGKVTKKRGGNLGTTANSKPPVQRAMTLHDLLE